jgi:hypothetical protein
MRMTNEPQETCVAYRVWRHFRTEMTGRTHVRLLVWVLAAGLVGCESGRSAVPTVSSPVPTVPSPRPVPATATLIKFVEPDTGFSTTELRDVQEQVVQINTANELIWTTDGTHLPGYRVASDYPGISFIVGRLCAEGCALEVRFGTKDGERRAYLTADYGHDNPGTLVDVEIAGGALTVARTSVFVPGTFTLSGVVTEATPSGNVPVEGVSVYRGVVSGWRGATTDRNGFYSMLGMFNGTDTVAAIKEGYVKTERGVLIKGDTRFDIQVVRR